ncbi:MAG: right-handed parallel beta-helix repeat-containing protein [Candidatus Binatia bacterium]|nr:right-handed parallel beta-helix repeat-containing protein [Candidatus Binatia bacterium]
MTRKPERVALIAMLLASAAAARAATLQVSNLGSDSLSCGPSSAPCRSISQAISNANPGDTIVVGPGLYGDINGDGDLADAGEENSGVAGKTILVSKPLTILSRDGAGATLIRNVASADAVAIGANGVSFGKKAKGFTVRGGAPGSVGVRVDPGVSAVSLMGNVFDNHAGGLGIVSGSNHSIRNNWWLNGTLTVDASTVLVRDNLFVAATLATGASSNAVTIDRNQVNRSTGVGIDLQGTGHNVRRNVVVAGLSGAGFRCTGTCSGVTFQDNVARRNNGHGFEILAGSGHSLTGNLATGNGSSGFYINFSTPTAIPLLRNTATNNGAAGFTFPGMTDSSNYPTLTNCVAVGNQGDGIQVNGHLVVTKSNLYGNIGSGFNCGINKLSSLGSISAVQNFWGSATGPGPDPADQLCGITMAIDASSPLASEAKVASQRVP